MEIKIKRRKMSEAGRSTLAELRRDVDFLKSPTVYRYETHDRGVTIHSVLFPTKEKCELDAIKFKMTGELSYGIK